MAGDPPSCGPHRSGLGPVQALQRFFDEIFAEASLKVGASAPGKAWDLIQHTIWLFNIAMGNDPFIDGLPIKNGDFPWLC